LSISRFVILIAAGVVSGCALAPYEETFRCPLSSNYGTCTDVSGAYADAVAAPAAGSGSANTSDPDARTRSHHAQPLGAGNTTRQLNAAEEPAAPAVIPPALLCTWIGAYQGADGTLFAPRYVFHLAGVATISGDGHRGARSPVDEYVASPLLLPTVPR
jgi:hypothetical protein